MPKTTKVVRPQFQIPNELLRLELAPTRVIFFGKDSPGEEEYMYCTMTYPQLREVMNLPKKYAENDKEYDKLSDEIEKLRGKLVDMENRLDNWGDNDVETMADTLSDNHPLHSDYYIEEIDEDRVKIGCKEIRIDAINRLDRVLKKLGK